MENKKEKPSFWVFYWKGWNKAVAIVPVAIAVLALLPSRTMREYSGGCWIAVGFMTFISVLNIAMTYQVWKKS